MIKNFHTLIESKEHNYVLKIIEAGLAASKPSLHLERYFLKNKLRINRKLINLQDFDNVHIIAVGKSASHMASFASKKINFKRGIVVMPSGYKQTFSNKKFKFFKSGHPLPNDQSLLASKFLIKFLSDTSKNDFIIFLISGGGSALLSYPLGISLKQKIKINNILIQSGAKIQEIACIRKHLSKIKGGRLVCGLNAKCISFVISDVISDDLSSISSGLTYFDNTTFSNAMQIIKKYNLKKQMPKTAIKILKNELKMEETPKSTKVKNIVVSNNFTALDAMRKKSINLHFDPIVMKNITGDVNSVSKVISKKISKSRKNCLIFGGEPTVNVKGTGDGGRNQELVLRIVNELSHKNSKFIVASIGTDGIDGNTKYAGAISSNISMFDIKEYLKNNDSYNYFKKYGGLIKTGPTHMNINDIGIVIKV